MAVQTTYNTTHAVAYAGQIANQEQSNLVSRTVETTAGIAFGKPVARGAADDGAIIWAGAGSFLGVTVRDQSAKVDPTGALDGFPKGDSARIMTKGVVWVVAGEAVADGDPVHLTAAGAFMKTTTDNTAVAGAVFDTSAASGALVKIRLG